MTVKSWFFPFLWKHYTCRRMFSRSKCLHMLRKNVKPSLVAPNEESTPALSSLVLIPQGKLRSSHCLSQSAGISLLNKEVSKAGELRKVSALHPLSLRNFSSPSPCHTAMRNLTLSITGFSVQRSWENCKIPLQHRRRKVGGVFGGR